jgi:hypothetical protein
MTACRCSVGDENGLAGGMTSRSPAKKQKPLVSALPRQPVVVMPTHPACARVAANPRPGIAGAGPRLAHLRRPVRNNRQACVLREELVPAAGHHARAAPEKRKKLRRASRSEHTTAVLQIFGRVRGGAAAENPLGRLSAPSLPRHAPTPSGPTHAPPGRDPQEKRGPISRLRGQAGGHRIKHLWPPACEIRLRIGTRAEFFFPPSLGK